MLSPLMDYKSTAARVWWCIRHVRSKSIFVLAAGSLSLALPLFCQMPQKAPGGSTPRPVAAQELSSRQPYAVQQSTAGAAAASPRAQLTADCAELLKLARELKAAIKKAGPDTLSLEVIRKSQAIQKLVGKIEQEMKPMMERR